MLPLLHNDYTTKQGGNQCPKPNSLIFYILTYFFARKLCKITNAVYTKDKTPHNTVFFSKAEGFALACGLGQGRLCLPPAAIHYRPVRILSNAKIKKHRKGAFLFWRRQRDSNPRGVSPKRFSRPPRYDRFDMPPSKIY